MYLCGINIDAAKIIKFINGNNIADSDFVHTGNFLFHSNTVSRKELSSLCVERNINIFIIRGSIDDPDDFISGSGLDNITFMQDNTFLKIAGKTAFACGGGISPDKDMFGPRKGGERLDKIYFDKKVFSKSKPELIITHLANPIIYPERAAFIEGLEQLQDSPCVCRQLENEANLQNIMYRAVKRQKSVKAWLSSGNFGIREKNDIKFIGVGDEEIVNIELKIFFNRINKK